ncbi:hypothetical protein OH76DRAFT_1488930 [Lentinus brumalis]|uniref:Uncharacterized protein n=1 Tax=Lentinus brumalis TaxID=2498619 RepID=A0A371CPB9_9APHY|nr:hypothetical protein OH76DRAFT_1488930 [Polyporus brumalis]
MEARSVVDEDADTGRDGRRSDTSHRSRAGRDSDPWDDGEEMQEDDEYAEEQGRWQEAGSQRLPTALRGVNDAEDVPVVVKNPHSDAWTIHQGDPEERLTGLSQEWMAKVWMDEQPVVLFTVFNYKFTRDLEVNKHIEASVSAMTTHLTGETKFHVVPPHPEWRRQLALRDLPFLWAIRGLPDAAAWEMIKARVISTDGVSIITHQRMIANPSLVCGLAGFLRPDVSTTKEAVLDVLNSEYMRARLTELVKSNDRLSHLPVERRAEKVIGSLEVRFMATKEDGEVANVYIHPPTDDVDEWRVWADEMRDYQYNIFVNGTGVARKAFWCGGCRGVDHEEPACPFPTIKGWKGPKAGLPSHTKLWLQEDTTTRKDGRKRGRGGSHWATGPPRTMTPTRNGRGGRGGWTGRDGHRGGAPRGFHAGRRDGHERPDAYEHYGTQERRGGYTQRGHGYERRGGYVPRGGQERRETSGGRGYRTPAHHDSRSERW